MKKCREFMQKGASSTQQQERQNGEVKTCVGTAYSEKKVIEGKIEEEAKVTR
jgi:hypothetical protein